MTLLSTGEDLDGWFCVLPIVGHLHIPTSKGDTQEGNCGQSRGMCILSLTRFGQIPLQGSQLPQPGLLEGPLPVNFPSTSEDSQEGAELGSEPTLWERAQQRHLASCPVFRKVTVGAPLL